MTHNVIDLVMSRVVEETEDPSRVLEVLMAVYAPAVSHDSGYTRADAFDFALDRIRFSMANWIKCHLPWMAWNKRACRFVYNNIDRMGLFFSDESVRQNAMVAMFVAFYRVNEPFLHWYTAGADTDDSVAEDMGKRTHPFGMSVAEYQRRSVRNVQNWPDFDHIIAAEDLPDAGTPTNIILPCSAPLARTQLITDLTERHIDPHIAIVLYDIKTMERVTESSSEDQDDDSGDDESVDDESVDDESVDDESVDDESVDDESVDDESVDDDDDVPEFIDSLIILAAETESWCLLEFLYERTDELKTSIKRDIAHCCRHIISQGAHVPPNRLSRCVHSVRGGDDNGVAVFNDLLEVERYITRAVTQYRGMSLLFSAIVLPTDDATRRAYVNFLLDAYTASLPRYQNFKFMNLVFASFIELVKSYVNMEVSVRTDILTAIEALKRQMRLS
jgi:hypothetical protein